MCWEVEAVEARETAASVTPYTGPDWTVAPPAFHGCPERDNLDPGGIAMNTWPVVKSSNLLLQRLGDQLR